MSATNNDKDSLCAMCPLPGTQTCAGCHSIRYCSKRCQKTDWLLHKVLCKTFQDFSDAARPKDDIAVYKRAIMFSAKEASPRWFWLRVIGPDPTGFAVPDLTQPPLEPSMRPVGAVQMNMALRRLMSKGICFGGQPGAMSIQQTQNTGDKNQSFLKIDNELFDWVRGTVFAHAAAPEEDLGPANGPAKIPWQEHVCDVTPTDFRNIVDFVRAKYDQTGKSFDLYTKGSKEMIKGARINAYGDQTIFRRAQGEKITLCKSVCDEASELDIEVGNKIGVPLVARRLPHALSWRGRKDDKRAFGECSTAMRLQLQKQWEGVKGITEPKELELAKAQMSDEEGKEGSFIVVRKDGRALYPMFLEALSDYNTMKICAAMEKGKITGVWKEDVLDDVSKEEWQDHYDEYVSDWQTTHGSMAGFMPVGPGFVPVPPGFPTFFSNSGATSGSTS